MKRFLYLLIFCAVINDSLFCMEHDGGMRSRSFQRLEDGDTATMNYEDVLHHKEQKYCCCGAGICGCCWACAAGGFALALGANPWLIAVMAFVGADGGFLGPQCGNFCFRHKYSELQGEEFKKGFEAVQWCTAHNKPIKTEDIYARCIVLRYIVLRRMIKCSSAYRSSDYQMPISYVPYNGNNYLDAAICSDDTAHPTQGTLTRTTCKDSLKKLAQQYCEFSLHPERMAGPPAQAMSALVEE